MSQKPESIKIDPWTTFPRGPTTMLFVDDFANEKLFTSKLVAKGNKSTLNLKETVEKKQGKISINDELKFWFSLPSNNYLYTKITSKDSVKVHYDNGIQDFNGSKWNFYGSFGTNRALNKINFKIGAHSLSEHCKSDNRFKISSQKGAQSYHYYHRTIVTHNKFTFGILGVFDIGRRIIQKNDFLINYKHNENNFFQVRGRVGQDKYFRNQQIGLGDYRNYFQTILFSYIATLNKQTKFGILAGMGLGDNINLAGAQFVFEKKSQDGKRVMKAKVTQSLDISLTAKGPVYKFEDLATITATGCISQIHKDTRALSYGFQLDLNV